MAAQPYRALRTVLQVLSALTLIASLFIISSGRPLMTRLLLWPPASEVSTLLLFALKEMGGVLIMLSVLLYLASRDPSRNVAIIDAFIIGLCVLAVTPLISLATLDIRRLYPSYLVWGRSVLRLAMAALLLYLRPREEPGGSN